MEGEERNKKIYIIIIMTLILALYLALSLFFRNHFYFGTFVNGFNISGCTIEEADNKLKNLFNEYSLELIERNNEKENIFGSTINLKYDSKDSLKNLKEKQKPFLWIFEIWNKDVRSIRGAAISYDESLLQNIVNNLKCLNSTEIIEPKNADFKYTDEGYVVVDEVYGNKIDRDVFYNCIVGCILEGKRELNLDNTGCYENPKYKADSKEVSKATEILDKYVSSKIYYSFDEKMELVDASIINSWLYVDEDMQVKIDENKINSYIKELASKYNTFGKPRTFTTSTGKTIEVDGGFYGWRINKGEEAKALINNIKNGQTIVKDPIYSQKAACREDNDIGDTYVEINITRQHLWFYKKGALVTQGEVVTGNETRNTPTPIGTYFLNYKQKNATLKGAGYSSEVTYWMPFNGNVGIHDASWRYSFGGNIYKSDGSHGCVNVPKYLASTIFDNIDAGTPIICYKE